MQKPSLNILTRDQFIQLRKAKTMIKEEFGEDVHLQDDNILEQIYGYALESSHEALFDLFSEIARDNGVAIASGRTTSNGSGRNGESQGAPTGRVKVGDIVDGKLVTGMYRGKPVFKD